MLRNARIFRCHPSFAVIAIAEPCAPAPGGPFTRHPNNPVFPDYSQGRGMPPTVSEAPPFAAGLARPPSMNGLDMSQAEGQSHMNAMPKVFSLSDLTLELGNQLATDGDVSLSLLAGESSGLGIFPRNLSLGDIAKLETM